MRLKYVLGLVGSIALGLGFARYRATGPEYTEFFGSLLEQSQDFSDAILAGVALGEGLGVVVERVWGRSPSRWGPGRWVWCLAASYLVLRGLDCVGDTVSFRNSAVYVQDSLNADLARGLRGKYAEFLIPQFAWFLLALGLTWLVARRGDAIVNDGRELTGRVFAALTVVLMLGFKVITLYGYYQGEIGGGTG